MLRRALLLTTLLAATAAAQETGTRELLERYTTDRAVLLRRYDTEWSPERRERLRRFYDEWQRQLAAMDFDALGVEGRIDHVLLANQLRYELALLDRERGQLEEMRGLLPFAEPAMALQQSRRRLEKVDAPDVARRLTGLAAQVDSMRRAVERTLRDSSTGTGRPAPIVAFRAMNTLADLRRTLDAWYRYYAGYDPQFTWWAAEPWKRADSTMSAYHRLLRERVLGYRAGEDEPIIADPIGSGGLTADLRHEMLAYSPEELIRIAEREFAWCEAEMRGAAQAMGFADWKQALEKVKNAHVPPGEQPELARQLAQEAIEFVESRRLVTVPALAREVWRMEMMSPERQRVAPFFLGGEVLLVAFPTDAMRHEEKLMSLRGNNRHFSRAVVHHELIPGHHLQGFMAQRHATHRRPFSTPFLTEGWALWWEMLLWDLDFARSPEDRVGMLFWRMHRAARIIFSLRVHQGQMTPREAIDFLVERVGHERANATAEVRRSFNGTYPPLYQVAYMMGGLQLRALHTELVKGGRMTDREFHDRILRAGPMPVELIRASLTGTKLAREHEARWRFAGEK
ncbi:MAG TPA: DUF885 family protein [Gemmatimonadaceae bacterium]|nr:DUF885 family protein [Gemmatimonadaceae bacterium]